MPRREKIRTPRTRESAHQLVSELFADSPAQLAEKSGLDLAVISRLLNGHRPATPEQIGRVVAILPKSWALKLMTAFLSDVAAASAPGFAVTVSKR